MSMGLRDVSRYPDVCSLRLGLEQAGKDWHRLWQLLVNLCDSLPWNVTELNRL